MVRIRVRILAQIITLTLILTVILTTTFRIILNLRTINISGLCGILGDRLSGK